MLKTERLLPDSNASRHRGAIRRPCAGILCGDLDRLCRLLKEPSEPPATIPPRISSSRLCPPPPADTLAGRLFPYTYSDAGGIASQLLEHNDRVEFLQPAGRQMVITLCRLK